MWVEYDGWTLHTKLYEHLLRTTAALAPTLAKLQDNLLDGKNMKKKNETTCVCRGSTSLRKRCGIFKNIEVCF